MDYEIICTDCDKKFFMNIFNTRIVGPHIEVTCPLCGFFVDRNVSKFSEIQVNLMNPVDPKIPGATRIRRAVKMQKFFRGVERLIIDGKDGKTSDRK